MKRTKELGASHGLKLSQCPRKGYFSGNRAGFLLLEQHGAIDLPISSK